MPSEITRIRANTIAEVLRQLRISQRLIALRLAATDDGLTRQRLLALQVDIAAHLEAFRTAAGASVTGGTTLAIAAGVTAVTGPLALQGIGITPRINARALAALSVALVDLINDISTQARNRINAQLAQVLIGTQPLSDAVTAVQRLLGGAARNRARTVVYTELGRINSAATQLAMEDAERRLPGLKKRWVRSGKKHPRNDHVAAHGKVVPVGEPFLVGGEKLMYPRDPNASARNTINCGCRHIPVVDGSTWGKSTVRIDMSDAASKVRLERPKRPPAPRARTP